MILFHRRAYHELGKTESQQLTMTYILQGWREKQKDKEGREQAGRSKGKSEGDWDKGREGENLLGTQAQRCLRFPCSQNKKMT